MNEMLLKLEYKWGKFIENGHAMCNKQMQFVSPKAYLNILYKPQLDLIQEKFSLLNALILPGLLEFYKQYNGCRLFFSSLNIFGVQSFEEETYEPFDLELENRIIQESVKDENYLFFASLGGDFVFAYRNDECTKIYAFQKGKKEIIKIFDNFKIWFSYYFCVLLEEYDNEGRKKHPNKLYKDIPALYHETNEFF